MDTGLTLWSSLQETLYILFEIEPEINVITDQIKYPVLDHKHALLILKFLDSVYIAVKSIEISSLLLMFLVKHSTYIIHLAMMHIEYIDAIAKTQHLSESQRTLQQSQQEYIIASVRALTQQYNTQQQDIVTTEPGTRL